MTGKRSVSTKAIMKKAEICDPVRTMEDTNNHDRMLVCPLCKHHHLVVKYEASHVYSYLVDSDAPGSRNKDEFLSFLYDRRDLTHSEQYVECQACGAKFPCDFNIWNKETSLRELQDIMNNYSKE